MEELSRSMEELRHVEQEISVKSLLRGTSNAIDGLDLKLSEKI